MLKRLPLGKTPLLALVIIASLFLQAPTYYFPLMFKNWPPPLYSTSYYIQNNDPAKLYDFGCLLGQRDATTAGIQDSLVILDFGKMWIFKNQQNLDVIGARTFEDPTNFSKRYNLSIHDLEVMAQNFATGYWVCSANDKASQLTLGIGTTSYDFFGQTNLNQDNLRGIMVDFGRNWANMINRLNGWGTATGYNRQVLFTGAIDIEWAGAEFDGIYYWNSPYVVRGWVDAFDLADNNASIFFNYGACVGCPIVSSPSWTFSPGLPWSQEDIWYVSWGSQPAYALPEIYRNDGHLAHQWAAVSKYGYLRPQGSSRIIFSGAMTQMVACQQRIDLNNPKHECWTLDNTPAEGWGQLVDAVNAETFTEQPLPQYSTDIRWQFK